MAFERYPAFSFTRTARPNELINWGQRFTHLPQAWQRTQGEDVTVCVVDTGIDAGHPDLAPAIDDAEDFAGSAKGPVDEVGHGTHVAGIIAARADGRGVVGVAPKVRILSAKVLKRPGRPVSSRDVAAAIRWGAERGARLICLSIVWKGPPHPVVEETIRSVADRAVVVCAAGNRDFTGGPMGWPARYPSTLAVGAVAVGPNGPAPYPNSSGGPELDLVAPGWAIVSTVPGGGYAQSSGTSMAAPFAAGVLALAASVMGPGAVFDIETVRRIVRTSSTDLYGPGWDWQTGWGLVDPVDLVRQADAGGVGPHGRSR